MKKLLVSVLAVALLAAATTAPFSAATSNAGIKFASGNIEPGDPTDPSDPDKWVPGIESNLHLYFGSQTIAAGTKDYASVNHTAAPYSGKGEKVGYVVINNTGSATQGYKVTVEVSKFTIGSTETMAGYTLTLTPESGMPKPSISTNTSTPPTAATVALTAETEATIFSANAGDARGAWGANWTGNLNVLGSTAALGDAQATMTWTMQTV